MLCVGEETCARAYPYSLTEQDTKQSYLVWNVSVSGISILYTKCSIRHYAVGYGQCWNRTSDPKRVMLVL